MKHRITASALIKSTKTGKYLLVKQPDHLGVYPGQWAIPGGGIEPNETMTEALIREIKEEIGIHITNIKPLSFQDDTREKLKADGTKELVYMIMLVFTADTDEADQLQLDPEADEYAWVTLKKALTMNLNHPTQVTLNQFINNHSHKQQEIIARSS